MKRLAIVIGGWHYPKHFYTNMFLQQKTPGWSYDFFVIGHRPFNDHESFRAEKQYGFETNNSLTKYDHILYESFLGQADLDRYGFRFTLEPNTIGDLEFLNQWMDKNDWSQYDLFLYAHDDAFILRSDMIRSVLEHRVDLYRKDPSTGVATLPADKNDNWVWLSNGTTPFYYHIRNSFDFISKDVIEYVGGHFSTAEINLDRSSDLTTPTNFFSLADWNKWIAIIQNTLKGMNRIEDVRFLSEHYRHSDFIIECERGIVSSMVGEVASLTEGLHMRGLIDE